MSRTLLILKHQNFLMPHHCPIYVPVLHVFICLLGYMLITRLISQISKLCTLMPQNLHDISIEISCEFLKLSMFISPSSLLLLSCFLLLNSEIQEVSLLLHFHSPQLTVTKFYWFYFLECDLNSNIPSLSPLYHHPSPSQHQSFLICIFIVESLLGLKILPCLSSQGLKSDIFEEQILPYHLPAENISMVFQYHKDKFQNSRSFEI